MKIPLQLSPEQLQEAAIKYAMDMGYINPDMFPNRVVEFPRTKEGNVFVTHAVVTFSDEGADKPEMVQQELPLEDTTEEVPDEEPVEEESIADTDLVFNQDSHE